MQYLYYLSNPKIPVEGKPFKFSLYTPQSKTFYGIYLYLPIFKTKKVLNIYYIV